MKILLTGGSRGIGKSIFDKFTKEGHEVIAPSRDELNLSEDFDINFKQVDVVINNAGINFPQSILDLSYEEEIMKVNYFSPLRITQHFLPHMKQQYYGRILNIGSIWVDFAKPGRSAYSASKNALHALTKAITSEYATYNILANTLSPGFIMTDMTIQNNSEEDLRDIRTKIPIGRLGYPDEVAELAYFLTVQNSYISGQNIIIDGGYSCTAK